MAGQLVTTSLLTYAMRKLAKNFILKTSKFERIFKIISKSSSVDDASYHLSEFIVNCQPNFTIKMPSQR